MPTKMLWRHPTSHKLLKVPGHTGLQYDVLCCCCPQLDPAKTYYFTVENITNDSGNCACLIGEVVPLVNSGGDWAGALPNSVTGCSGPANFGADFKPTLNPGEAQPCFLIRASCPGSAPDGGNVTYVNEVTIVTRSPLEFTGVILASQTTLFLCCGHGDIHFRITE